MTVEEMKQFVRATLSPCEFQQWLRDQKAGKRPSWEKLAQVYTEKGL